MDRNKLIETVNDLENKSNKDLLTCLNSLADEFEKTKNIIIDLTHHLDKVESLYKKVDKELENRKLK